MKNGKSEEALELLEQFIPTLQFSIDETRTIYMGLRPKLLDDFGVIAAMNWYRLELMKLYPGFHIEPEIRVEETDIPEHLKVAIFRISQEAMNNTAKHAGAEWVDLVLVKHDQVIELSITDDGIGFDLDDVPGCERSYGLSGMKERTEQTGGRFTVESVPGEGTTVRAVWGLPGVDYN
jgi:signal transduction histidine kinase